MTSISEHFAKLGDCFAADTETALAPKCFEGRDQVRLFQAWSPDHNFWLDLAQLSDNDWSELKINLENCSLSPRSGTTPPLTYGCCRDVASTSR